VEWMPAQAKSGKPSGTNSAIQRGQRAQRSWMSAGIAGSHKLASAIGPAVGDSQGPTSAGNQTARKNKMQATLFSGLYPSAANQFFSTARTAAKRPSAHSASTSATAM